MATAYPFRRTEPFPTQRSKPYHMKRPARGEARRTLRSMFGGCPRMLTYADVCWRILTVYAVWPDTCAARSGDARVWGVLLTQRYFLNSLHCWFGMLHSWDCHHYIVTTCTTCMWVIWRVVPHLWVCDHACSVPMLVRDSQHRSCILVFCDHLEYFTHSHSSRHHQLGQMRVRLRSEHTFVLMFRVGLPFWSYIWVTLIFRCVTFVLIGQLCLLHLSDLYFVQFPFNNITSNNSFRLK